MQARDVLSFWFDEIDSRHWWSAEPAFDQEVRSRFGPCVKQAARGECRAWRTHSRGRLAEIIVLDQFSRNAFRGTAEAFAQDAVALVLAQEAIARNSLAELANAEKPFLLMPFMHSESALIHDEAIALLGDAASRERDGLQDHHKFEMRHKLIIDRFGRFPHRNSILGRDSTSEEVEFLKQPGSRF